MGGREKSPCRPASEVNSLSISSYLNHPLVPFKLGPDTLPPPLHLHPSHLTITAGSHPFQCLGNLSSRTQAHTPDHLLPMLAQESSSMTLPQNSSMEGRMTAASSLTSRPQHLQPPPFRSSMKAGGNAHEAAAAAAAAAVTDTQQNTDEELLPVVFVPAMEELVVALEEVTSPILVAS
eukprot:1159284-Pelagomonas_calceolata.AAC.5